MSAKSDRILLRYTEGIFRWRWLVLLCTVLIVFVLFSGGRFLAFTSDYRVFFGEDNAQLNAYDKLQNVYTKTDNILIAVQPDGERALSLKSLPILVEIAERAWKTPFAIRVDSITNFQHIDVAGDDIELRDLVRAEDEFSQGELSEMKAIVMDEPILFARLISRDGRTVAINITLQLPQDDPLALASAVGHVESFVEQLRSDFPEYRFAISGRAPLSKAFADASARDMQTLIPAMFGLIAIVLLIFFRSISATFVALILTIFSILSTMGIAGWLGIKISPPSAIAPTILLTIAIADSVHILSTILYERAQGLSKLDSIKKSIRLNTHPVFLTTITTIVGFVSLNFSDSPPFRDLGNLTAIGVLVAWLLSMTFLPAIASLVPMKSWFSLDKNLRSMSLFGEFVVGHHFKILAIGAPICLVLLAQIPRIDLDDRFVEYFDSTIPFRADSDFIRENLSGIYDLEFSLNSGQSGGIYNPEYLEHVDRFVEWMREQPKLYMHVSSITDTMKRVNQAMNGGAKEHYVLPETRELAAQYLLVYEMSLPYGLDVNSQINIDKSSSRVSVVLDNLSTKEIFEVKEHAENWLKYNVPNHMITSGTGASIVFAHVADNNIRAMLLGTAIAFVLISFLMIVAFGSFKLGFLSLVPNILPALLAFGVWGILEAQIGLAISVIAATSLGLVVDSTVFLLSKYVKAKREEFSSTKEAILASFGTTGPAIWVTTITLIAGFALLSFSSFSSNADMGLLTAIAIAFALFIDFILLPPLLLIFDRRKWY